MYQKGFISHTVFDDTLFLDDMIFTCEGEHVKISDRIKEKTLIVDDRILPVVNNLFMGMTRDEVESVLGATMSYRTESSSYSGGYQGNVGDDIYGFDAQLQLVYVQKQLFYEDAELFGQETLDSCIAMFGAPKMRESDFSVGDTNYHEKRYSWEVGDFRVILSQAYNKTRDIPGWASLTFAK